MAYRLRYQPFSRRRQKRPERIALQSLWAGILLGVMILGSICSDRWRDSVDAVFLPEERPNVKSVARNYARGEDLREILLEQCRQILIEAGYEG